MVFDLLAMALLDGEIAEVFRSPFVVPVAGCLMIACIVVSSAWARVRSQEMKSHERLARIAQGLPVDPNWDEVTIQAATGQAAGQVTPAVRKPGGQPNDGSGARRAGVVLTSIGLGLFIFFALLAVTLRERDVFAGAAAGVLPLAIGIGFLVDAKNKKEEYERRFAAGWYGAPNLGAGVGQSFPLGVAAGQAPPPPPPPPGMTAAQASDWRPSSSTLK